jgi:hypothetical protein
MPATRFKQAVKRGYLRHYSMGKLEKVERMAAERKRLLIAIQSTKPLSDAMYK